MISTRLIRSSFYFLSCVWFNFSIHPTSSLQTLGVSSKTNFNTLQDLGKQSSALDVLKTLNNNKGAMAPYVKKGGTAIVTGGSSGIGTISVETLALSGMKVILCARDLDAGKKVLDQIKMTNGEKKNIVLQKLDLADLESVECAVKDILEMEGEEGIDLILNNAGIMATPERMETKQGFELQFGTNHVGHHMFTRLLLPNMREGGRVVTVASTAHTFGSIDLNDLNYSKDRIYTPWGAYGQSKLANILFAKGLDNRLKGSEKRISSFSLHPGVISTNLWKFSPRFLQPFTNLFADKTVEQGAATSMFCCLANCTFEEFGFSGGDYVVDCRVSMPNENGQDRDGKLRNQLWDETEKMIQDAGFILPETLV